MSCEQHNSPNLRKNIAGILPTILKATKLESVFSHSDYYNKKHKALQLQQALTEAAIIPQPGV